MPVQSRSLLAKYLTPLRKVEKGYCGAAYNGYGEILLDSLRRCERAGMKHRDPVFLHPTEMNLASRLDGRSVYLGHLFMNYGHFLLESLPMIGALISLYENKTSPYDHIIFLPGPGNKDTNKKLLTRFLRLLSLDRISEKVLIHNSQSTLNGEIKIIPRPISINHGLINPNPYHVAIKALLSASEKALPNHQVLERIFLRRRPKRYDEKVGARLEELLAKEGFVSIAPEKLSLEEQILTMANAKLVAGFLGSQLHNAVFAAQGSRILEFGDERHPNKPLKNQHICSSISSSQLIHINYQPTAEEFFNATVQFLS